jgi:hypothetical protein
LVWLVISGREEGFKKISALAVALHDDRLVRGELAREQRCIVQPLDAL